MSKRSQVRKGASTSSPSQSTPDFEQESNKPCKTILSIFYGLSCVFLVSLFTVFSTPVYLYRYILANVIVPRYFRGKIGRPVTPTGNIFATEFLQDFPPRCALVTNIVMEGTPTPQEVRNTIQTNWIDKMVGRSEPFLPELQQYVERWMGFLFWKQDFIFDLDNHLVLHKIPRRDDATSEAFVCSLMEELVNKPFQKKRSPWEIHMVQNYVNSELNPNGDKELTTFIFRFHHALADGFSILYAIVEGLFGTPLSEIELPSTDTVALTPEHTFGEAFAELLSSSIEFCGKAINDIAYIHSLLHRPRTNWHVGDKRKTWKQLYARSQLIPVEKIRLIKDKLGVSFTGVLFSCISAGVSKSLKKVEEQEVESMATLIPLPLTGHPRKLENHVAATVFDLPVKSDMQPICRLMECEHRLQKAKDTTLPILGVLYAKIIGSHLALVANKVFKNSVIPMGLSNFPGPKTAIAWKGREGLTADFAAGAVTGVAGVGFMVFSYRGFMRIAATAENAVMTRNELEDMIHNVCAEIEILENSASMMRRKRTLC